jgi:hypothetical protein
MPIESSSNATLGARLCWSLKITDTVTEEAAGTVWRASAQGGFCLTRACASILLARPSGLFLKIWVPFAHLIRV